MKTENLPEPRLGNNEQASSVDSSAQKIVPFLWFNNDLEQGMDFYTSIFKDGKVVSTSLYGDAGPGPKGTVMSGVFKLSGQQFYGINGGPAFSHTPAISLFVTCQTEEEMNGLWNNLRHNGTILMELKKYPFSEKYGWVQDKFGISWQLNLTGTKQNISPCLMFANEHHGNAEKAIRFYISQFKRSEVIRIERYGPAEQPGIEGTVKHASFLLNDEMFMAMDSPVEQPFNFSPAISFFVNCDTQQEIDSFWEKLSEGGEQSQCGWLKDQFGIWWQIVPKNQLRLISDPDPQKVSRVMKAMMQMRKLDMAELMKAYNG